MANCYVFDIVLTLSIPIMSAVIDSTVTSITELPHKTTHMRKAQRHKKYRRSTAKKAKRMRIR